MATQTIIAGSETFGAAAAGDSFYITGGRQAITGNSDYSGQNTSVLAEVQRAFTGRIGTSTNPWKTAFSSYLIYNAVAGEMHWESNSADTETTAIVSHSGGGHLYVYGSGILTRYEQVAGSATIASGTTLTTARAKAGVLTIQDVGGGPAITLLRATGAQITCARPITTADVVAGQLTLEADTAGAVNAHGTINADGGRLVIKASGTITKLNWESPCVVDVSMLDRPLTITAIDIDMSAPGAQAFLDHPLITCTTAPTFGGTTSKRLYSDGRPL